MVFFIHNREYILSWVSHVESNKSENAREQARKWVSFSRKNTEFLGYSNFQSSISKAQKITNYLQYVESMQCRIDATFLKNEHYQVDKD